MAGECPCDAYPRILEGVLSDADVMHLKKLFQELAKEEWERREQRAKAEGKKAPPRVLEYFTVLKHLQTKSDHVLGGILRKLCARVEATFGENFVIVQDFWSWRAPGCVGVPRIHMDADFWMTKATDGFNLWLLLDEKDMAHSFDIFPKEKNRKLYRHLRVPHQNACLLPLKEKKAGNPDFLVFWEPLQVWPALFEYPSRPLRTLGMAMSIFSSWWIQQIWSLTFRAEKYLPPSAFRILVRLTGWMGNLDLLPDGMELETQRFELRVGDALVVRQDELHVSDQDPLKDHQFRLAVGFKFMRQSTKHKVQQYPFTGPAGKNRRRFPALRLPLGHVLPDLYMQRNLDMTEHQTSKSFIGRLFARSSLPKV